jgi:hypothetical protein
VDDGHADGTAAAAAHADRLIADAVHAWSRTDTAVFARCADRLAADRTDMAGWPRGVDRKLVTSLVDAVTAAWRLGWRPADVVAVAGRRRGGRYARMATDVIAAEMRRYAAATVDEGWQAQLSALGARQWWSHDDGYPGEWAEREGLDRAVMVRCALELLAVLATLPLMARLGPLPGESRRPATGRPEGPGVDRRMLGRVRALLAKAESTEFPEEAEALSARAQELMARHSIDHALLAAESGHGDEPSGRRLAVDHPYEAPKTVLLDVVAKANRCRVVWHRNLGLCTVLGYPGDLDAVELLFTSLLAQATAALVRAGSRRDAHGRSRTRSFRHSFLTAYAQRIGERLSVATEAAQQRASAESPATDLLPMLAARDEAVDRAVGAMFPTLADRTVTSAGDREGWMSGRAAADLAALHTRDQVSGDGECRGG